MSVLLTLWITTSQGQHEHTSGWYSLSNSAIDNKTSFFEEGARECQAHTQDKSLETVLRLRWNQNLRLFMGTFSTENKSSLNVFLPCFPFQAEYARQHCAN